MADASPAVLPGFAYDPAHNLWRCDEAGLYVTASEGNAALYRDGQDEAIATGPWLGVAFAAHRVALATNAVTEFRRITDRALADPRATSDHMLLLADAMEEFVSHWRQDTETAPAARALRPLIDQLRDAAPSRAAAQTVPTPQP